MKHKKLFNITMKTTFKDVDDFFDKFIIIGYTVRGERFRLTRSSFSGANSINLYRGKVWGVKGKRRQLLKSVTN